MSKESHPEASDDRSLMERIHAGDPSALDELLGRYWRPLVAYAQRFLPSQDAAEDVVQETMIRVWRGRADWTPSHRVRAFLYRITRNLALNERDRRRVRQAWASSRRARPAKPVATPLDVLEQTELRELLDRAVDALPPRRRETFLLARYHGHSYPEIAEIMDVSPQTVANQMSASLNELRETLRPQIDAFLARGRLRAIRGGDVRPPAPTARGR